MQIWIILAMVMLLLVVFLAIYVLRKENEYEPDYRVFFILGVTWIPLGIATKNNAFLVIGVAFMAIGLANRSKWKEQPNFSDMAEEKRRLKVGLILGVTLLLVVLAGVLFLMR